MLSQAQINVPLLRQRVGEALQRLPQTKGQEGHVNLSSDLNRLLNVADKLAQQRGDQFIASELFLLAAVEDKGEIGKLLREGRGRQQGRAGTCRDRQAYPRRR